ncbi:glycosyltransferase family 4 protein [Paraburkholderia humisilvae]|uniref:D-inositol-3-phosphate glycosyltransferase n=1 Tax=Paraburkholderia humisilvae TaxID=627669 RepID=A0A6J5F2I3_9BURK|nr:glycosyltransferase family 4 protein [Paraburkholderia humisilvae]CAB3773039.1 D-inositol-3-phosphate glycosyltransferase [Paraburkholderia humisilvae]
MKITFILPRLTAIPTGGGKIIYQYANALASVGHSVEVLHPRTLFLWSLRKGLVLRLLALCVDCVRLLGGCFARREAVVPWMTMHPAVRIRVVPALFACFVPDADVVVASLWRTAEYVRGYPASKGRKFYLVQHYETWSGPAYRVDGTLKSTMCKIVISSWLGQLVKELSGDDAHQVPNPVDHDEFFVTTSIAARSRVVSMLYSAHAWKGSADGISALEHARAVFPELRAIVFGTSERPDSLPHWIKYMKNPKRRVLRDVIYNASSIYLCPSWSEGWGLPALEAMACGCAIVTADNGGIRDFVISGQNGFVVPPKAPRRLGTALVSLLGDKERRTAFAEQSVEIARQFTLGISVEKLLAAFMGEPKSAKP